jgi:hypothetical protein
MPISLSKLRDRKADLEIDLGEGDSINLIYHPNKITPGYLDDVSKKSELMTLAETVAEFIFDWDIESEPGVKLPVDVQGAAQLGIQLLNLIITSVAQDMRSPLAAKRRAKS